MASTLRLISAVLALISVFAVKEVKAASECPNGHFINVEGICTSISPPEVIKDNDCTNVTCPTSRKCPLDSYLVQTPDPPTPKNLTNETRDSDSRDLLKKCCKLDCRCYPCPAQKCGKGDTVKNLRQGLGTPGKCCSLYECVQKQCIVQGKLYEINTTWMKDDCHNCTCRVGGFPLCEDICKENHGEEMLIGKIRRFSDHEIEYPLELDIKETPSGCTINNKIYNNGEIWKPEVCTECFCENGKAKCTISHCKANCLNPRYVSDECCPICDDNCHLVECDNYCTLGFVYDGNNCQTCQCILNIDGSNINISSTDIIEINHSYTTVVGVLDTTTEIFSSGKQGGSECFIWIIVAVSVLAFVVVVGLFMLYRYVKKCKITTNEKVLQPKYEQVAGYDSNPTPNLSNKEKIYPDLVNKI